MISNLLCKCHRQSHGFGEAFLQNYKCNYKKTAIIITLTAAKLRVCSILLSVCQYVLIKQILFKHPFSLHGMFPL